MVALREGTHLLGQCNDQIAQRRFDRFMFAHVSGSSPLRIGGLSWDVMSGDYSNSRLVAVSLQHRVCNPWKRLLSNTNAKKAE